MNIRHFTMILAICLVFSACPVSADWKTISNSIKSELDASPSLGAHEIGINVRRNHVYLTGEVSSIADSKTIEDIARRTNGVKSVQNNLKIKSGLLAQGTKEQNFRLSAEVVNRISKDPTLGYHNYAVVAKGGLVTISGKVASAQDRARIEEIARGTPGVDEVELALDTMLAKDDKSLVALVRQQLEIENGINLSGIDIAANQGVVTFSGSRSNHRDIDHILSLALMVPGVRDIRSQMRLDGSVEKLSNGSRTNSMAGATR